MGKKITGFKTKGMNRDLSVSAFNPEFAFENRNLRLGTNEANTTMSWVNERGPKQLTIEVPGSGTTPVNIQGTPIGTAVLNRTLVLFTHKETDTTPPVFTDYIYKLEYKDNDKEKMSCVKLYEGDLHFRTEYPLETLVSYEAEHVQKVYWTDGINQPRIINIEEDYTGKPASTFDFVPELQLGEEVTIERNVSSGGAFPPGVIQYCFTYINKYRQQSNVAWVSSLYYLTHDDRGASPEDFVTGSFKITIDNPDTNIDYLRLYSIQRTSIDAEPIVKLLDNIDISGDMQTRTNGSSTIEYLTYVDNGTTGAAMDPFELLYVGGKEITAKTLADSNNTLFLGNITSGNMMVDDIQEYFSNPLHTLTPTFFNTGTGVKQVSLDEMKGVYSNTNMMAEGTNLNAITTYKGGETYRFGFQLQSKTGEWSEPIYLSDIDNTYYPKTQITGSGYNTVNLVTAKATIPLSSMESSIEGFHRENYKKIRPVVVFPNIGDRKVICQGVVNPTVFNPEDRIDNSPFAQSSWYFRPYMANVASEGGGSSVTLCTVAAVQKTRDEIETANNTELKLNNPATALPYQIYYAIYVYIPNTYTNRSGVREEILGRKYLNWTRIIQNYLPGDTVPPQPEDGKTTGKTYFKGAIDMSSFHPDTGGNPTEGYYILLGTQQWQQEKDETDPVEDPLNPGSFPYYYKDTCHYDDGVQIIGYVESVQEGFYMYSGLKVAPNGQLYNDSQPTDSTGNYNFYFYYIPSGNNPSVIAAYKAEFPKVEGAYVVNDNKQGSPVEFTHYKSLPTEEGEASSAAKFHPEKRTSVEIQGSLAYYTSPFGTKIENPEYDANSQFFVDQSIITMHSPDIEFDTDVQNFGMANVKMRIVGAVPITSNASAHSIRISSPMLERSHNLESVTTSFGAGERSKNVVHSSNLAALDGNAGNRLVSGYFWNDVTVKSSTEYDDNIVTSDSAYNFLIFPWQRQGSLNNDTRPEDVASSTLKTKKESNILYSYNTAFIQDSNFRHYFDKISAQIFLTENSFIHNMRLPQQDSGTSSINYYPNIDKVLYNTRGYKIYTEESDSESTNTTVYNPVSMRYKSTSHAVIALNSGNPTGSGTSSGIAILPYGYEANGSLPAVGKFTGSTGQTIWGDSFSINQRLLNLEDTDNKLFGNDRLNYLWLAELYRDVDNPFGGTSKAALRSNKWVPAGEAVSIPASGNVTINWTEGDTYYQRYDCLKTYPFTNEDQNQLVEILSFMCETKVNIDGRYDKNRGQMDNTNMSPRIFNILNPVYSQRNNFFPIRQISQESKDTFTYPNLITYSKTKTPGADVDLYTNVTLASNLDLDGDKGEITAIRRFNDQLIAFQDTGIARIIYNVNAAVATTTGVPIEIANSGKVEGKQYYSDTIGCSNRDSMVTTPLGIYFMDSHDKSIYLFNGQLANLSIAGGMNSWTKKNIPSPDVKWNPVSFDNFRAFYDRLNQDVLFVNKNTALAWSEKLSAFTSFYDYGNTPYFNNLDNTGIWVRSNGTLWKHNAGNYCNFFGVNKPYSMTLVGNPEPQADKIFTNLEFRATIDGDGEYESNEGKFYPSLPFDSLETWNEHQHGIAYLKSTVSDFIHHSSDGDASLLRKFRIWRCDIPRNNALLDTERQSGVVYNYSTDTDLGISRYIRRPMDRMRNPWLYMKLGKNAFEVGTHPRTEIHDVLMTYFD